MTKSRARQLFRSIQIGGVLAALATSSVAAQELSETGAPDKAAASGAPTAFADMPVPESSDDEAEDFDEEESAANDYRWHTAAGRYADPTSFFSLHGYVNGVFASGSPDWNTPDPSKLQPPGQVHIPNTKHASMGYDAALVFGSQIGEVASLLLEIHFTTEPSGMGKAGPGALAIGVPEAAVSLVLVRDYLTLSAGQYHAPFANVNTYWLLAQNLFTFMPKALGAFPTHWNERGVRINGSAALSRNFGMNYVVSVGNGLQNFNISGQKGHDRNANKTVMGRLGPLRANVLETVRPLKISVENQQGEIGTTHGEYDFVQGRKAQYRSDIETDATAIRRQV